MDSAFAVGTVVTVGVQLPQAAACASPANIATKTIREGIRLRGPASVSRVEEVRRGSRGKRRRGRVGGGVGPRRRHVAPLRRRVVVDPVLRRELPLPRLPAARRCNLHGARRPADPRSLVGRAIAGPRQQASPGARAPTQERNVVGGDLHRVVSPGAPPGRGTFSARHRSGRVARDQVENHREPGAEILQFVATRRAGQLKGRRPRTLFSPA